MLFLNKGTHIIASRIWKTRLILQTAFISHTQTAKGKIFVSFLALIVQAYLLKQLKSYMQKNCLTLYSILLELDKMKTI